MAEPRADLEALFERARTADITAVAGVPLFRAGGRWRGECPLCGASKGKRAAGAFSVDPGRRLYKCFACGDGGDVVKLERAIGGGTLRDAAERLAGAAPLVPRPAAAAVSRAPSDDGRGKLELARALWRESKLATDTPVAAYLAARGIVGETAQHALRRLRFHPSAYWGRDGSGDRIWLPAMVAQIRSPAGPTGGVHVTYLAADGHGKTRRLPARRMIGPQSLEGAAGGVWLLGPACHGPLLVGEGIESTLSAAMLEARPMRMVATLALNRLQGGWLADRWGRLDPRCPSLDPARGAFTWPEPEGARWGEVVIAVDRDMAPIRIKQRRAGGGAFERTIDAEERARICAGLAVQAWRRAGANAVRAIAPGPGRDFNDELVARRARRAA